MGARPITRRITGLVALASLAMLGGCSVSIDYTGPVFSCELDGHCPPGQDCVAGICQSENLGITDASISIDGQPSPDSTTTCVVEPATCDVAHCIPNTVCSVVVDGVVDEFAGAPSIVFQLPTGENTVTIRAMWDTTALYLAYNVQDTNLTGIETVDGGNVYLDDCVHWFLDGANDGGMGPNGRYMLDDDYHGIVNLLGTRDDEQGDDANPGNPVDWNSNEWLSAVTVNGTANDDGDTDIGMTIEVKIPWSAVGFVERPSDMDLLGLGLGHTDTDSGDRDSSLWLNLDASFQNAFNWQTVRLIATQ